MRCWYWRKCWPSLSRFLYLFILVELLTITVFISLFCWYWWNCWPSLFYFLCFVDIYGNLDQNCFKLALFRWYWWKCWTSLFKLSFVLLILVELLTITVQTFFCFVNIGENVDHNCLKFLLFSWYWWNCWPSLFKFLCFVDIGGIVDHHCFNFLLFCWSCWNCWSSLLKIPFPLLILVELFTITV